MEKPLHDNWSQKKARLLVWGGFQSANLAAAHTDFLNFRYDNRASLILRLGGAFKTLKHNA